MAKEQNSKRVYVDAEMSRKRIVYAGFLTICRDVNIRIRLILPLILLRAHHHHFDIEEKALAYISVSADQKGHSLKVLVGISVFCWSNRMLINEGRTLSIVFVSSMP